MAAAKIMNFTKVDLETQILTGLSEIDEELAMKVQDNMFTFENLSAVDNRAIQTLMRNVEPDMLMTALKGAHEEVKDKFLGNMSQRAKIMFLDDMEAKGPIRITDVEDAQKAIMRIARKLSDAGDLVLAGRGDDLSKGNPEISWKLNDLLEATRKAKSFAENSVMAEEQKSFHLNEYKSERIDQLAEESENIDLKNEDSSPEIDGEQTNEANGSSSNLDAEKINLNHDEPEQVAEPSVAPSKIVEQANEKKQIQETSFKEGYDNGFADGVKKTKAETKKFESDLKDLLENIKECAASSNELYEPLKKLAMGIAVQLVRGELSVSPLAVERLIKNSLAQIDEADDGNILIFVSEFDKNQLDKFAVRFEGFQIKVDTQLSKGSVRIAMGDSIIEDFIESRLSEISDLVFDNGISDVGDLNLNDQQEYQTSDAEASDFDVLDGEIVDSEKHEDEHKKEVEPGNDSDPVL